MKRALLAFDKYKGSLSASRACTIAEEAIKEIDETIAVEACPLSDGGEGFVEIVTTALGGVFRDYTVTYPGLNRGPAQVGFVFLNNLDPKLRELLDLNDNGLLAIIEMAQAAGHHLVPNYSRNPWLYTTGGVGELIRYARAEGATSLLFGMGGSATNDMGVGLLEALGLLGFDDDGKRVSPLIPENWEFVSKLEFQSLIDNLQVRIACDVRNPLHGPEGAAAIFGPQKGLKPEDQERMQSEMCKLSAMLLEHPAFNGVDLNTPGLGAAGGLPFGLSLVFDTKLIPGFDLILEILQLQSKIERADMVFTGEGALDKSSLSGKGPYEIVKQSILSNKAVSVLPGKAFPDAKAQLEAMDPNIQVIQVGDPNASIETNILNEPQNLKTRVQKVITSFAD